MSATPLEESTSANTARIYLIRHGETEENRTGVIQGQLDTALNEDGIEQARIIGDTLQSTVFDSAYSSDLKRASTTAEAILKYHPTTRLRKQEELRERFLGGLQGTRLSSGANMKSLAAIDATIESGDAFAARTVTWWNKSILQYTASLAPRSTPYHVLVVTHGGFISTLVKTLIRSREAKCDNGVVIWGCRNSSITVIEVESNGKGVVVKYGDVAHLEKAEVAARESNADQVNCD